MQLLLLIELLLLVIMLAWALCLRQVGKGLFLVGSRYLSRWSRQRGRAAALVGMVAFGFSAGLSLLSPPVPAIHDEFSYLLAADTFAHGRLAAVDTPTAGSYRR